MSRTRLAGYNYFSSLALSITTMATGFVAAPFLVQWLGEERFGAYRTTLDWLGYLTIPLLSLQAALFPLLTRVLEQSDQKELQRVMMAGVRACARVSLAAVAVGLGLAAAIPLLASAPARLAGDLRLGCLVGLAGLLLWPLQPFHALTEASQRRYVLNGLLVVQTLLTTTLALLLAWRGWGVTGQFLAVVVGGSPSFVVLTWAGVKRFPGLGKAIRFHRETDDSGRQLRKLNSRTMVIQVCGRLSLLTDNIVIAFFLGPAAVTPFFLTQRLVLLVQQQLQGIGNASWAGLAQLHHQKQFETFNQRLVDLTRLTAVLGIAALTPMAIYNRHFIRLWVGAEHFAGEGVTLLVAVNAFLQGFFSLWGWCFQATGRLQSMASLLVLSTMVNVVFSTLFTYLLGLPGPLLGTLIAFASVNPIGFAVLLRRSFGVSLRRLTGAILAPVGSGVPFAALVWWIAHRYEPTNWLELGAETAAAFLFYMMFWWLIGFSALERRTYRQRFRAILGWNRK